MLTKLNNDLVKTTIKYLDNAEPYLLKSITNKLNIKVSTDDKYDYGVYMDDIETYCYASLENTAKEALREAIDLYWHYENNQ